MENNKKNVFETLSEINVNSMVEKKQTGNTMLTYLSWASAWQVAKENFPDIEYEIEKNPETGLPYWYDPLTGYMVFTKITLGIQTHEMWLPVMDGTNHAMKAEPYTYDTKYKKGLQVNAATMTDINKTIMRCLVKNLAMFGLGLYIYQGEDLPSSVEHSYPIQAQPAQPVKPVEKATQPQMTAQAPVQKPVQKDTRPVTTQELEQLKKTLKEYGIDDEMFICDKYKIKSKSLGDLQMYQYHHILANINKLKQICDSEKQQRLADMVKNAKKAEAEMSVSFGDAIAPPQPKEDDGDGEPIDLASLGLSPADLEALSEAGAVFS